MKTIFWMILVFCTSAMFGQNMLNQHALFKELGIRKVTTILMSSTSDSIQEKVVSEHEINPFGYVIKSHWFIGTTVSGTEEYKYFDDTLFYEKNIMHVEQKMKVKFSFFYNEVKKRKTLKIFNNQNLISITQYFYNKHNKLEKTKSKQIAVKRVGTKRSKSTSKYTYDSLGRTLTHEETTKFTKNNVITLNSYVYSDNNDTITIYSQMNDDGIKKLKRKTIYNSDHNKKMIQHNVSNNTTFDLGNGYKYEVNKGDAKQIEYFYDLKGLLVEEVRTVGNKQIVRLKYNYN